MPYRHVYQSFEVRRLLQQAENAPSPITAKGAHSRGLHAMRSPGGVGVNRTEMMDRTHKRVGESNNHFKNLSKSSLKFKPPARNNVGGSSTTSCARMILSLSP